MIDTDLEGPVVQELLAQGVHGIAVTDAAAARPGRECGTWSPERALRIDALGTPGMAERLREQLGPIEEVSSAFLFWTQTVGTGQERETATPRHVPSGSAG